MNARHALATVVLLASCATFVIGASAPRRPSAVALGNFSLTGGSATKEVDTSAITPGDGPEMVGQVTNGLGRAIHDLTVKVERVAAGSTPPTSDGNTSLQANPGTGSATAANTNHSSGFTANLDLSSSALGSIPPNGTVDLAIDLSTTGNGSLVKVFVTPSVETMGQAHADVLRTFKPSEAAPGATHALEAPFHDRGSMFVANEGEKNIKRLVGRCSLPSGAWLSSVHLRDPSSAYIAVPGANVQLDGESFVISGFTQLEPSKSYEVITVFSSVPDALYKVSLEAEFAD